MLDVLTSIAFVVKMLINSDPLELLSSPLFEVVSAALMADD